MRLAVLAQVFAVNGPNRVTQATLSAFPTTEDRERLVAWIDNGFSLIYWMHDHANPNRSAENADNGALPAGHVRAVKLVGTLADVSSGTFAIESRTAAVDELPPPTPIDERLDRVRAPVPDDFFVYVQVTDRSQVVLLKYLALPRDPRVFYGNAWEQMRERFMEQEEEASAKVTHSALPIGAPGVCSAPGCTAAGTLRCTGCSMFWFCSRECQARSWPAHKTTCKGVRAGRKAAEAAGGGASGS